MGCGCNKRKQTPRVPEDSRGYLLVTDSGSRKFRTLYEAEAAQAVHGGSIKPA